MPLHITIDEQAALAEAAGWVARHLPARPAMPVLAGAVLEASETGMAISGFDYETATRLEVPATVHTRGHVIVSGRLLAEITKLLPRHAVEFATEGELLTVTCRSSQATLPLLPEEEYPTLPAAPEACGEMQAAELAAAVARVAPAASTDDATPQFTCLALDIPAGGGPLQLYATDRYRLATATVDWTPVEGVDTPGRVLISARMLETTTKALAADAGGSAVRLGVTDGRVGLATEHRQVVLARMQFEPIDYEQHLAVVARAEFTVPTAELAGALKRLALHRDAPFGQAHLAEHTLRLAVTGTAGASHETLAVDYDADPAEVRLQIGLLAAAAATIDTDLTHVTIPQQPTHRPWLLRAVADDGTPRPGFRYAVAPAGAARGPVAATEGVAA